ncbi:MAG: hypothetical protein U9N55_07065 [candidate division Zixibacteria bacterium]|nr:hypothetical protein [candidate division Zixibacteria bacterium]
MNKNSIRRIALAVLGLAFVAVATYVTLITTKVVSGVSLTAETPDHVVNLRVLDAGVGDAKAVVNDIIPYLKSDFEIRIVETAVFEVNNLTHSFVISHEKNRDNAIALAERLGLNPDEIIYKPLEYNNIQASATLVAGLDFDSLLSLTSYLED